LAFSSPSGDAAMTKYQKWVVRVILAFGGL
jgi:hypothetical protein